MVEMVGDGRYSPTIKLEFQGVMRAPAIFFKTGQRVDIIAKFGAK